MKKFYKIFFQDLDWSIEEYHSNQFKNQFDTKEECVNFMLNPENSHLFNEEEEYTVMEIFKKLPKNKENEKFNVNNKHCSYTYGNCITIYNNFISFWWGTTWRCSSYFNCYRFI